MLVYLEAVFITLTQKDWEEIDKLTHKETFKINTIIRIRSENHSLFRNMKSMIVLNHILNLQEQNINSGFVKNEVIQEPEERINNETETMGNAPKLISEDEIRNLYLKSDEPVDWTELLISTTADDVFMEQDKWNFLKGISHRILSGDIDAYLETIEKMRPVDDLLDYGSQFEFGTDNPKSMEVEFQINQHNDMISDGTNSNYTMNMWLHVQSE